MKEAQKALLLSPPINPLFGLLSFFNSPPPCISSLLGKCLKVMLMQLVWQRQAGARA